MCSSKTKSHPIESFEILRWLTTSPSRMRVSSLRKDRILIKDQSGRAALQLHTSHRLVSSDRNRPAISENRRSRLRAHRGWRAARVDSVGRCASRGGETAPRLPCTHPRAPRSGTAERRARGGKTGRASLPARPGQSQRRSRRRLSHAVGGRSTAAGRARRRLA